MKKTLLACLAPILSALTLTPFAQAAVITHDSVGEFSSIVAFQGQATTASGAALTNVSSTKSNLGNMFDSNPLTSYALGLGGTGGGGVGGVLELLISPTSQFITSSLVVEGTVASSSDQETALISLGVDGGGYIDIGTLFNAPAGGPGVTNLAPGIATLSAVAAGDQISFSLTLVSGAFNSLRLWDKSSYSLGADGTPDRDGFDVSSLSITSTDTMSVPTPGTLALAGLGLLGLGVQRHQSRDRARRPA